MKTSLLLSALLGASALLCAAAEPAKTASSSPSPTAEAAKKAGFDEKVWPNPEFEEVKDVKKTTWKVADGKIPAGWYLQEAKKGAKEFAVLKHPDGKGSFIRISGGTLARDVKKIGQKNLFHFRYRGKGNAYLYMIPYNKKTGSNLKSKLFLFLKNVDVPEWKDEVVELDLPVHPDGERRVFWFVAFDGSSFDVDSIYMTTKD